MAEESLDRVELNGSGVVGEVNGEDMVALFKILRCRILSRVSENTYFGFTKMVVGWVVRKMKMDLEISLGCIYNIVTLRLSIHT
jgi:hypothetical protein